MFLITRVAGPGRAYILDSDSLLIIFSLSRNGFVHDQKARFDEAKAHHKEQLEELEREDEALSVQVTTPYD